jgi:hypothetical protein
MGDAPSGLQQKLGGIFSSLVTQDALPRVIACYGEGVRLACEGSPVLEQLKGLTAKGVHVTLCQACLDYFGIRESVRLGIVGGMGDIVAAQAAAAKVISV